MCKAYWESPSQDVHLLAGPRGLDLYKSEPLLGIEDRVAMEKVEKSLTCVDGRYQVGISWKENSPLLQNNYEMAFRRLQNTEQRLFKKTDIARAYSDCIKQYISKLCIRKVPVTEEQPSTKWLLPHFPIVKPDRMTTKMRIVFDASAKYQGVSLNDVKTVKMVQDNFVIQKLS